MLKSFSVTIVNGYRQQQKLTVLAETVQEARQVTLDVFGRNDMTISKILSK